MCVYTCVCIYMHAHTQVYMCVSKTINEKRDREFEREQVKDDGSRNRLREG